jgi:hypothetical protein
MADACLHAGYSSRKPLRIKAAAQTQIWADRRIARTLNRCCEDIRLRPDVVVDPAVTFAQRNDTAFVVTAAKANAPIRSQAPLSLHYRATSDF